MDLFKKEFKISLFGVRFFEIYEDHFNRVVFFLLGLKIKITKAPPKTPKKTKEEQEKDKNIIINSGFWDADWYIKKYYPKWNQEKAIDYWYSKGWLRGEAPSKYFDKKYIKFCKRIGENPVLYYLKNEFRCVPNSCNPYKTELDSERIREYLEYKKTRKSKSVVYTCITNNYDDIREIDIYGYIDKDWDYVCFTDDEEDIKQGQVGIWEIRPLQFNKLDNTRNNRWHKLNPHLLFPEYQESIYIDPNINIISDYIFRVVRERDIPFIQPRHFKNNCIYEEYLDVINAKLDSEELINSEFQLIKSSGMPKNYGFGENNLLYRRHNLPEIVSIDSEWWEMVSNYAKRDQLSLAYLLWKHGINIKDILIENTRLDVYNFFVFAHKKGNK